MNYDFNSITKAFLATFLYIIGIELIGCWFLIAEAVEWENYYEYYFSIQGVLQLIAVLTFIYFIKNRTFKNLIRKTRFKWYLFALILGVSFVFVQTPLNWLYNFLFGTEYNIAYRFDGLPKFINIIKISPIILIPIGEEIFFREYIQNKLQKRINNLVAIGLTAVLFALIHSPYMSLILETPKEDWHLFYMAIFGGIISGILFYKSKSVGPSIIFHIFWNVMVEIV